MSKNNVYMDVEEDFCLDCEELIIKPKPSVMGGLLGHSSQDTPPKRFKKGWKCGHCYIKGKRK